MKTDILIAGVGGQGILLTTNVIGQAAVRKNYKVIGTETHGMAQRGGSVVSHVRIGDVYSPLIPKGHADFLISLEPAEALRNISYLRENGFSIINIVPFIPRISSAKYPKIEEILENLLELSQAILIDAIKIAEKAGSRLAANIAILGATSAVREFPLNDKLLKEVILESVPPKTVDINLRAFDLGREEALEQL
jgi:indolepyruvate ferredoxin oxidoreductase beta subunit